MNDKRNDLVLLYDKNLPEHLVREIQQLKRPRKEGGFGWKKVVPWESFVGGECDTVVYVGSGSLEAFSRARLKLMIITVAPREQRGSAINYYAYIAGLRNSVEKNILEKKIVEKTREDSSQTFHSENEDDSDQTPLLPIDQNRLETSIQWVSVYSPQKSLSFPMQIFNLLSRFLAFFPTQILIFPA